jgi:DNA-binding FadR family transcriptional regulator
MIRSVMPPSTRSETSPFRVPKTAELIVQRLRDQIIRGDLNEGDVLPNEAELVEKFGVSRPTLREALRILESESLLDITRGMRGGARVVIPSEKTAARYVGRYLQFQRVPMIDVHQATIAIELPAVASLARQHQPSDLVALRNLLREGEERLDEDLVGAVSIGNDFHRLLVDLAGNRTLAILHGMIEEVILASGREIAEIYQSEFVDEVRRFHGVHQKIVNLISSHDEVAAERLWRKHLEAKIRVLEGLHLEGGHDSTLVELR